MAQAVSNQFLHQAMQPFWKLWTGVDEISYRITPTGDGKSALDGMFGHFNTVLVWSAVDQGSSYFNSLSKLKPALVLIYPAQILQIASKQAH